MLIGKKEQFAIEYDIATPFIISDRWVYGHFLIWVNGLCIGDPFEAATVLRACSGWCQDLLVNKVNRYEPGLYEISKRAVFRLLVETTLVPQRKSRDKTYKNPVEVYDKTSQFDITHIGMDSFYGLVLLLIENNAGDIRLLWRVFIILCQFKIYSSIIPSSRSPK